MPLELWDDKGLIRVLAPEEDDKYRGWSNGYVWTVDPDASSVKAAAPPRVGHRHPNEFEIKAATDFERMQEMWESRADDVVEAWQDIRQEQIDELVRLIEDAVAAGDMAAIASVQAPVIGAPIIQQYMVDMASEAVIAAKAEAAAQKVLIDADVSDLVDVFATRSNAIATIMARGISESAARQALLRYGIDNLTPAEVAAGVREHLEALSDRALDDILGGAMTQAQNAGRHLVFSHGPTRRVYASELLDSNTCVNCAGVDGREYTSLEDAMKDYPLGGHKDCLGGPRCRGTLVAVYDESDPS